jgi:hypothetical protein
VSLAVRTFRPALRVARFRADLIFSFDSTNSESGTFSAEPVLKRSKVRQNGCDNLSVLSVSPSRQIGLHHRLEMHRVFLRPILPLQQHPPFFVPLIYRYSILFLSLIDRSRYPNLAIHMLAKK